MKLPGVILMALLLCGSLCNANAAAARNSSPRQLQSKGVHAAHTLSMITGVAISPLLGVSAIGAYTWWKAPAEERSQLNWYAQPWFWLSGLILVGLAITKDVLGTAAPTVLKKPFDVIEAIENKISALIVAGAFIPLIVTMLEVLPEGETQAMLGSLGFATIDAAAIGNALLVPFAILTFAIVWLASNAINILILLSPFTTVDAALKLFRGFILSLVTVSALANAYVGAAFALVIIIVAFFIAGWSFRLSFFGTVFTWDFCTLRRKRFSPSPEGNRMFTARSIGKTPVRSYGRLIRCADGKLQFKYRPFLLFPAQRIDLSATEHTVGRGLFCPDISRVYAEELIPVFLMSPRYRTHEEEVARIYGLDGVRDVGLLRGYRAVIEWLKEMFGLQSTATNSVV